MRRILLALWALAICSSSVLAQLNDTCIVSILNRNARVDANGNWRVLDVPSGQFMRARATCVATVGWTVAPGPVTPTYSYKWTVRRNNAVVLKEGKLDLSEGQAKIEVTEDGTYTVPASANPKIGRPWKSDGNRYGILVDNSGVGMKRPQRLVLRKSLCRRKWNPISIR